MRKTVSFLAVMLILTSLFSGCSGKTPDEIAAEEAAAVTLDTVTWTIAVEGGTVDSYSRSDAEEHELSKIICSMMKTVEPGENGTGAMQTSFICGGIHLREFLEDVGRSDATRITYYGKDLYQNDISYSIEGDLLMSDDVMLGWIRNKSDILFDTWSYVGVFGASSLPSFTSCCSVDKIVIE